MRESFPAVTVVEDQHVVEDGDVLTSAGISAGIDLALRVVARHHGEAVARATARHMEYPYPGGQPEAGVTTFAGSMVAGGRRSPSGHDSGSLGCQEGRRAMNATVVEGDLLDQPVEVIVNAWNRNVIPWWLLLPQGVSGAIKRRGGTGPFRELGRLGPIPLGGAVLTSAGRLPFKAIIHVAGINLLWRASERSIRDSVRNALDLAQEHGFRSIAFPLIGAGSGGFDRERAKAVMLDEFPKSDAPIDVTLVSFKAG